MRQDIGSAVHNMERQPEFMDALREHRSAVDALVPCESVLLACAVQMVQSLKSGGKVVWFGNGGSAADAQHLSAELVGRFLRNRKGLASLALTTDTSALTAISNDYGFESVFSRQVEALVTENDVVVGISTSGNSPNVVTALNAANLIGAFTIAFTGKSGGEAAVIAKLALQVDSQVAARIQEAHIFCGHFICEWVEHAMCLEQPS